MNKSVVKIPAADDDSFMHKLLNRMLADLWSTGQVDQ